MLHCAQSAARKKLCRYLSHFLTYCFGVLRSILLNVVCSKVMFALQIGSWRQLATCNVLLDDDVTDGQVLLQYTRNRVSLLLASANDVRSSSRIVFMAALRSRYGHYIFVLSFVLLSFFPSPNLGRRRVDVYHTSAHDVALVRI